MESLTALKESSWELLLCLGGVGVRHIDGHAWVSESERWLCNQGPHVMGDVFVLICCWFLDRVSLCNPVSLCSLELTMLVSRVTGIH